MNSETTTFTAEPAPTRMVYLKTALVILGVVTVIHVGGQWRNPPLIDSNMSLVVCVILGLLMIYGLTRAPFNTLLGIDYDHRRVVITYLTLTKTGNSLEIPFARLSTKTDTSFGVTGYGTKWKTSLLLDGKEVCSLTNSEPGFSEKQMNEFIERVKLCEAKP